MFNVSRRNECFLFKDFLKFCKTSIRYQYKAEMKNRNGYNYSQEAMINELNFIPNYSLQDTIIDTANSLMDCSVVTYELFFF